MSKYLIIVESPNKVKHIQEFVGRDYKVMASFGHIREINDSGKYKIGVDYDNNFETDWIISAKKKEVVSELKKAAKEAEVVYLASDDDNEGEAIAWHLREVLKLPAKKVKRAVFKEITKSSVLEGLKNAGDLNVNKALSALCRAKLDKIMGYRISTILLIKTGGKSGGRVQSVALKIVCDREKEINAFVSKEYYEIYLPLLKDGGTYRAQYKGTDAKKLTSVPTEKDAIKVVSECIPGNYVVSNVLSKDRKVTAKPPFITSSLQQECSSKLGYSPKATMQYAQSLFENGYITYLRTDSTRMSDEFISSAKDYIIGNFGEQYYSGVKVSKKKKGTAENVQDAHEAIRCTDVTKTPEFLKQTGELYGPELRVYALIYNRCVSSLMADSIIVDTNIEIKNGNHNFVLTGHKIKFDGFQLLYIADDEEKNIVPSFLVGEKIQDRELEVIKKKTNPPSRYTEASLIKKLEELKIGRPSTYASMAGVVTDEKRGYTVVEGKTIRAIDKGLHVNEFTEDHFDAVINYTYTAELEEKLDKIATGELTDIQVLSDFWAEFKPLLTEASKADSQKPKAVLSEKLCPKCGKQLAIRHGAYGDFYGCSGFPRCRYIEKIVKEESEEDTLTCPVCKIGKLVKKVALKGKSKGKAFYACNRYPDCKTAYSEADFKKLKEQTDINPLAVDGD